MIYVGQLPSIKLLGTMILSSGYDSLSCVLIGQTGIFTIFVLSETLKSQTFYFVIL